ncbi:MAG: amidase [Acidimicrobiales bacterium]
MRDPLASAADPSPSTAGVGFQSVSESRRLLEQGSTTSVELVETLLSRIAEVDAGQKPLRSVIAVCPDAVTMTAALDAERARGDVRGPLHGIPVLVKDNIDTTGGEGTTAGSLALAMSRPLRDAVVVQRLRAAGAIVLAKTNLSEWANFRARHSSSGWSAVGGQCVNPHALNRSPGGSSSGSGAGVAAGLAPISVGTETDGSILCPAALNGVVGIKPTVGLTSRSGVVPISSSQDTVGPFARSVADAADLLGVLAGGGAGLDALDDATAKRPDHLPADYSVFCDLSGLSGARIGVARQRYFGNSEKADEIVEAVLRVASEAGAVIVDPVDVATAEVIAHSGDEMTVLLHEFKAGVEAYLATRPVVEDQPRNLSELIEFNETHAAGELGIFGQDVFIAAAAAGGLDNPVYLQARERNWRRARQEGIEAAIDNAGVDVLAYPTMGPAWCIDHVNGDSHTRAGYQVPAVAGYPAINLPVGKAAGLPIGLCLVAGAWSEPTLIRIAFALEQALALGTSLRPGWLPRID